MLATTTAKAPQENKLIPKKTTSHGCGKHYNIYCKTSDRKYHCYGFSRIFLLYFQFSSERFLQHTDFVTIQTKHYSIESVIWKKTAVVYGANKAGVLCRKKCHEI